MLLAFATLLSSAQQQATVHVESGGAVVVKSGGTLLIGLEDGSMTSDGLPPPAAANQPPAVSPPPVGTPPPAVSGGVLTSSFTCPAMPCHSSPGATCAEPSAASLGGVTPHFIGDTASYAADDACCSDYHWMPQGLNTMSCETGDVKLQYHTKPFGGVTPWGDLTADLLPTLRFKVRHSGQSWHFDTVSGILDTPASAAIPNMRCEAIANAQVACEREGHSGLRTWSTPGYPNSVKYGLSLGDTQLYRYTSGSADMYVLWDADICCVP